jgi:translation initiation factor IF-3
MAHPALGRAILDRIVQELQSLAVVEQSARMEGRNMFLMLSAVKKQ